ncbi:MAG: HDOD domain-containing protein, partial [Myxococcota bacterium]
SPKLEIPPAPTVALKLQEVLSRDDFGGPEIVRIVETDAALSASVLRYANSASRAGRMEITELPAAVSRVGIRNVAQIALAEALGKTFGKPGRLAEVRSRLWQRSLVSAFVCQSVAKKRGTNADQAFTAGLLHDFGAAVVLAAAERVLGEDQHNRRSLDAWTELAMESHTDVGRIVASDWELGDFLTDVMVHHHEPEMAPEYSEMLELILASDRVCGLVEQHVEISEALLIECFGDVEEARLVADELPKLAERVEALSHAAKAPPPARSAVTPSPESTLHGRLRKLEAGIEILDNPDSFTPAAIATDGLVIFANKPLALNTLARVLVRPLTGESFMLWCNPTLDEPCDRGHRVELRPFALGGLAKRRFNELFTHAEPL